MFSLRYGLTRYPIKTTNTHLRNIYLEFILSLHTLSGYIVHDDSVF